MRKLLLTILTAFSFFSVFAQRHLDFDITLKEPAPNQTITSGQPFNVVIGYANNGPDTLGSGDSVFFELAFGGTTNPNTIKGIIFGRRFHSGDTGSLVYNNIALNGTQAGTLSICAVVLSLQHRPADSMRLTDDTIGSCTSVNFVLSGIESLQGNAKEVQVFPNPANDKATISYDITKSGQVNLGIFDMTGKSISNVVNENQNPGKYSYDVNTSTLNPGIYLYKLSSGDGFVSGKLIVTK